jgi:hypothetical protein
MLKRLTLGLSMVALIGILVWGGINRTLAKSSAIEASNSYNQQSQQEELTGKNHERGHQNDDREPGKWVDELQHNISESDEFQISKEEQRSANGSEGGSGSKPLDESEIDALKFALDDEYHALAVYQSVISTFGEVDPFVELAESEQRHINALHNQFDKNGLSIPENPWLDGIPVFDHIQQACQFGVETEVANAELYDRLINLTDHPSLIRIFTNLRNASLNNHLPKFESCQ